MPCIVEYLFFYNYNLPDALYSVPTMPSFVVSILLRAEGPCEIRTRGIRKAPKNNSCSLLSLMLRKFNMFCIYQKLLSMTKSYAQKVIGLHNRKAILWMLRLVLTDVRGSRLTNVINGYLLLKGVEPSYN
jgi:hypothetical protein